MAIKQLTHRYDGRQWRKLSLALFLFALFFIPSASFASPVNSGVIGLHNEPYFTVEIQRINGITANRGLIEAGNYILGGSVKITVDGKVCNLGPSGIMRVESGIYKRTTLKNWGLTWQTVQTVANCNAYEQNVQAVEVNLAGGACTDVQFTIPYVPSSDNYLLPDASYAVDMLAYKNCWSSIQSTGQTDYDVVNVWLAPMIAGGVQRPVTCTDGIQNQGETDTDCGGLNCNTCANGYLAVDAKRDCRTGYASPGWDGKLRCADVPINNQTGLPDFGKYGGTPGILDILKQNAGSIIFVVLLVAFLASPFRARVLGF